MNRINIKLISFFLMSFSNCNQAPRERSSLLLNEFYLDIDSIGIDLADTDIDTAIPE